MGGFFPLWVIYPSLKSLNWADTPGKICQGYCAAALDSLISGWSGVVSQAKSLRDLPWGNAGVDNEQA
jgi:hypothetical protein